MKERIYSIKLEKKKEWKELLSDKTEKKRKIEKMKEKSRKNERKKMKEKSNRERSERCNEMLFTHKTLFHHVSSRCPNKKEL